MSPKLWSTAEVAERLGVAEETCRDVARSAGIGTLVSHVRVFTDVDIAALRGAIDARPGTGRPGLKRGFARRTPGLSPQTILDIRQRAANGESLPEIAERYGLTTNHVGKICRGDSYPDLPGPLTFRNNKRKTN